jgi:hypothetical protein
VASIPVLELTFESVAGSPWEGLAAPRFQGETGPTFPVRENLTQAARDDLRWYIEEYPYTLLDRLQEERANRFVASLETFGRTLWQGLSASPLVQQWLGVVQRDRAGRLELRAKEPRDETAFRTPWELLRVGGGTLLHQLGATVVRRPLADLPRLAHHDTSSGLPVLSIVCRPDETGFLDSRYSPEALLEALTDRSEVGGWKRRCGPGCAWSSSGWGW